MLRPAARSGGRWEMRDDADAGARGPVRAPSDASHPRLRSGGSGPLTFLSLAYLMLLFLNMDDNVRVFGIPTCRSTLTTFFSPSY